MKFPDIKPDDRLTYSSAFIRSIHGNGIKGRMGTAKEVTPLKSGDEVNNLLVKVLWDDETEPKGALASNLKKVKK